jgi:hypothetical protein
VPPLPYLSTDIANDPDSAVKFLRPTRAYDAFLRLFLPTCFWV